MAIKNTLITNLWAAIVFANGIKVAEPNWNGVVGSPGYAPPIGNAHGGIDFSGAQIPLTPEGQRQPLYLTVQGNAVIIRVNFGQGGIKSFAGRVPPGYFPGWPGKTGYDVLDLNTVQGSAVLGSGTDINFTGEGMVQGTTPVSVGNYYFELSILGTDVFTVKGGGGISRYKPDLDSWLNGCQYQDGVDTNGGAALIGRTMCANGNQTLGDLTATAEHAGTILGFAVSVYPGPSTLVPVDFTPVPLTCVPCDSGFYALQAAKKFSGG